MSKLYAIKNKGLSKKKKKKKNEMKEKKRKKEKKKIKELSIGPRLNNSHCL